MHFTDDLLCAHPHAGQRLHTQESGDDGLSSNMEHKFSENYSENDFPVADKGSFVRPIPKEQDTMTRPILNVHPNSKIQSMGLESQSESAEESLIKPPTPACAQNNFPPQDTLIAPSDEGAEEATDKPLLTTTITEEQPHHAEMAEDGGIVNISRALSKCSSLVPDKRRKSNYHRKRAAGKKWKLYLPYLVAIAIIVPVSEGLSVQSFVCKDKDKCPKLMTIYGPNDTRLYHRDLGETFPKCSTVTAPPPQSCTVCTRHTEIIVTCPEAVGKLEGETNDGAQILNMTFMGEQQLMNAGAPTRLGISGGLLLMAAAGAALIKCTFDSVWSPLAPFVTLRHCNVSNKGLFNCEAHCLPR